MRKVNPLRRLREAIAPTKEEISQRGARDRAKPHLLQRELADRIRCSAWCVRKCEREGRPPRQGAVRANFLQLYKETFGTTKGVED